MKSSAILVSLAVAALLLPFTTATGFAQPAEGELLFTATGGGGGLFYVTPPMPSPSYSLRRLYRGSMASATMAWANDAVICGTAGSPRVLYIRSNGSVTSLFSSSVADSVLGIALDQDGSYVYAHRSSLYRLTGTKVRTLWTHPYNAELSGLCRDKGTGDFVVGEYKYGRLLRVDRLGRKYSTLASGLKASSINGVAYIPRTDTFAVSLHRTTAGLAFVTRSGKITYHLLIQDAYAVDVDEQTSSVYVARPGGEIRCIAKSGQTVWTKKFGYPISDIDIWGDRKVSAQATGAREKDQIMLFRFNRSKGKTYVCALSFGMRPGIPVGGGRLLNLAPDPLFFLTLGRNYKGLTSGFVGKTSSSSGVAAAKFILPKTFPFYPIYFAAAALNPSFPGGLDISNTVVVKPGLIAIP